MSAEVQESGNKKKGGKGKQKKMTVRVGTFLSLI